ncbi:MAG: hypothetical protein ABW032_02600, partial [Burkholderiaceae bacterium]
APALEGDFAARQGLSRTRLALGQLHFAEGRDVDPRPDERRRMELSLPGPDGEWNRFRIDLAIGADHGLNLMIADTRHPGVLSVSVESDAPGRRRRDNESTLNALENQAAAPAHNVATPGELALVRRFTDHLQETDGPTLADIVKALANARAAVRRPANAHLERFIASETTRRADGGGAAVSKNALEASLRNVLGKAWLAVAAPAAAPPA